MLKKVLATLLSVSMIAASLAGCGSASSSEAAPAESSKETTESSAAEESQAEEGTAEADYSAVKVGMILGVTIDDGGFTQAQYMGVCDAFEALGMSVEDQLVYVELVAADNVAVSSAAEELMGEGCNVLISASTSFAPIVEELAPQYPDVQFCQVGVPMENCLTYHYRAYESMYAIGYMCAKMSETNELGYVGGMSEASVRFGINGFALGARAANPDATVNVLWANSWYDPAVEGECAKTLIASGIKYIGTGTSSAGAPQAAEAEGAYTTCFDLDHKDFAPKSVLASFVFDWSPIFKQIIEGYVEHGMTPYVDNYFWGAAQGCSKIAFNDDLVDADTQAEIQGVLDKIASGEIEVYAGELKNNEGEVLVEAGKSMDDAAILNQEFLVENVIGTWK